jgi:hypothetical protein
MEPTAAQFGHLFSWRSSMDLSHAAAYRYNHNMMEYYTCKSKSIAIRKHRTFNYNSIKIKTNVSLLIGPLTIKKYTQSSVLLKKVSLSFYKILNKPLKIIFVKILNIF